MKRQNPAQRLTKRVVDDAICPPGRRDIWLFCSELRGFAVRITAQGAKVFHLQYKAAGKVKRLALGEYGAVTVDQARKRAEVARGEVKAGGDPKAVQVAGRKAARDAAKADAFTLRALASTWRELHLDVHRKPRYAAESERTIHLALPAWLDRPAASINATVIQEALDHITRTRGPGAARQAHRLLRAAFEWTRLRGDLPRNPLAELARVKKGRDRDRALTDAELAAVWRAAEKLGHPYGPFIRFLILTLQRREDLAGMSWAEVSPDLTTWTQPAGRTKNGRPHIVHLAPAARSILRALPRFQDCPLVFTNTGKTGLSGFSPAKARLDRQVTQDRAKLGEKPAELAPWRFHDLRRTGVTTMARLGISSDVADRILNHAASASKSGVKAVYQMHEYTREREKALSRWASHVLTVASVAGASGNVVPMVPRKGKAAR
jgi:integrase